VRSFIPNGWADDNRSLRFVQVNGGLQGATLVGAYFNRHGIDRQGGDAHPGPGRRRHRPPDAPTDPAAPPPPT
jgi:hypothetical protein